MSEYCIHIELPPYLRQWLLFKNGGSIPVSFPRFSLENKIMELFLMGLPKNARPNLPTENSVAIAIPSFRYKPPEFYNYLPVAAREDLANVIRKRFVVELWSDLHQFGYIGKRRDNLITAWMEAHGIEYNDTNWNAIAKIYQRQHKTYLENRRYQRNKKKSKSLL